MTTLAWDGKTLAADSRSTLDDGFIYSDEVNKIIRCPEGDDWRLLGYKVLAYGVCGDSGCEHYVTPAMSTSVGGGIPTDVEFPPNIEFSLIVICRGAVITLFKMREAVNCQFIRHGSKELVSLGSGTVPAKTAMLCGLSAEEAVKISMRIDSCSGGQVRTFTPECNFLS